MKAGARHFFSNPWVGFFGSLSSVIGLGLAIYFYVHGRSNPELRYMVSPARTSVVHRGEASRLDVHYDGHAVQGDISAVQVAVWNAGNGSIRKDRILEPIVLQIGDSARVLEATVRKTTRSVVALSAVRDSLNTGSVFLNWRILERNDGGVVQVIYAGPIAARVTIRGVIEGQRVKPDGGLQEKERERESGPDITAARTAGQLLVVLGLIVALLLKGPAASLLRGETLRWGPFIVAGGFCALVGGLLLVLSFMIPGPPFPF